MLNKKVKSYETHTILIRLSNTHAVGAPTFSPKRAKAFKNVYNRVYAF